ncbi:MAG TPA: HAD family acid phosphatase [Tahibacter sp.]|uniref:5'-nucleotidase, lipoprotein e(P4) family n=1 Tax=Tahibacter sp. TaxID=2056211 RepID=UPI002C8BFCC9|nr:HAD family acid phosphatase [Tahibacter sp.]HSX59218.1 HAD family acid phosphatase [Tahibacter sp.]
MPFLLLLAGCAASPSRAPAPAAPEAPRPPPLTYAETNLNATLWAQGTVEHDMAYRGIYAQATRQITLALKQKDWDALPKSERKKPARGLKPAVIVDVDETVLDNSPYQARLIRDGKEFDEYSWDQWCREQRALALPGALEFAQAAAAKGVTVFYLTNRAQHLNEATLANLRGAGFPVAEKETVFLGLGTVVEGCEASGSDKGCRRELIGRRYRVLALVGDQLGDFIDVDNNTVAARAEAAKPYANWFGERWFMLPNPTYGSWDSALLGNQRGAEAPVKHQIRRDALRTE